MQFFFCCFPIFHRRLWKLKFFNISFCWCLLAPLPVLFLLNIHMVKETVERCSINDHDIVVSCIKGCIISRLYSSGEMEYLYCSNLRDFFLFYCPEWKFSFFGRYCGQRSYSKFLHLKSCDVFIQFCNLNKYFFFKFYLMYSLMGASLQIFGESESKKLVSEWDELLIKFKNWMLSYMYLLSLNSRPTIFFSLLECPYENLN